MRLLNTFEFKIALVVIAAWALLSGFLFTSWGETTWLARRLTPTLWEGRN